MSKEEAINCLIKDADSNKISDGYHTFEELYEHRMILWIEFLKLLNHFGHSIGHPRDVWRSKKHSDGSEWEGWFLLGVNSQKGFQITYHLPISKWNDCEFAKEIEQAPEFDGHTSGDVIERIKNILR